MKRQRNHVGAGERFIVSLVAPWPDVCIDWPFSRNIVSGYGQASVGKKKISSHRASAIHHIGPAPSASHEVAHSCGNRACCNPAHLRWATRSENHADKRAHGTALRGEKSLLSRLTESDVIAIRALAGSMTHEVIAKKFGMSRPAISLVIERRTWAHVGAPNHQKELAA